MTYLEINCEYGEPHSCGSYDVLTKDGLKCQGQLIEYIKTEDVMGEIKKLREQCLHIKSEVKPEDKTERFDSYYDGIIQACSNFELILKGKSYE